MPADNVIPLSRGDDADRQVRILWGRRIRARRTALQLSLELVAERMATLGHGVSPQAIGQWERGTTAPRGKHQFAVAAALETGHAALFAIDDEAAS